MRNASHNLCFLTFFVINKHLSTYLTIDLSICPSIFLSMCNVYLCQELFNGKSSIRKRCMNSFIKHWNRSFNMLLYKINEILDESSHFQQFSRRGRNTNCISNVNVRKNCWHRASFFDSETVYDSAAFQISITRFRFQWRWQQPGVFIVNFEHISHFFSVSVGDFEQVNLHSFFIRTSKIGP